MRRVLGILSALIFVVAGCGGSAAGEPRTLTISAIPDQDPQELSRLYGAVSTYLSDTLGVEVVYEPVTDYTASVTAFRRGDLDLVFFGGLTGVQARLQVPGARAIAQRDIDAEFRSVFIAGTGTGLQPITDVDGLNTLAGRMFTFGSEVSTSGRLMPQHFLDEAGVALGDLGGQPGFSGSHDTTIALVSAGTFEAGVLNQAVWDERLAAGEVDTTRVREIFRTPTYHDYHWVVRPDVDERLGDGMTQRITDALLSLDPADPQQREVLELFSAQRFIPAGAGDYRQIEQVAREAGLIR